MPMGQISSGIEKSSGEGSALGRLGGSAKCRARRQASLLSQVSTPHFMMSRLVSGRAR